MANEVREMVRRSLLVLLGLFLAAVGAAGVLLFSMNGNVGAAVVGGSVVAFLIGRALINWIFLKS